ncbi:LamG domain-containing protein, partial [Nostoc sp.]|uniref:LamG domain-containing protein n=1 Tax=Nostoc sp. TaxID=1180 RepID=UPI002FF721AB
QRVHAFGHQSYNLQLKPNENNSDEQKWQKWKFVDAGGGHYFIYNIAKGDNQRVHAFGHQSYNLQLKPNENNSDEQKWQKWKLVKTNETTNTKIQDAEKAWQDKREKLQGKKNELAILNQTLNVGEAQKNVWKMRLNQVINIELKQVQTDLNELNTAFINGVENTQQTPQTMPTLTDSKGLVTQGALLGFVRPASRLSAIETCEGNVQLSYFDNQGRMRQTNFDATSDSRNANVEQWLPDAQRVCLKIAENNHVVKLENPIYLGNEWTIEAWFSYPLPQLPQQNWNTLTGNQDGSDRQIVVKDGEQLGTYYGGKFHDSGYNIKLLSNGWHHLTAVAKGDTTLFYIDGKKVGDVKQKAIEAQTTDAGKKELEKQIFKSSSPISTIGNTQANSQQFGKLAEVRIWEVALSEEEIAVNSKTLLSGNEPGLRAYYPMNEATGTTVRDSTGNERNHGTIVSASWWGCAAPIGNAGHQVVQFDGVDDSITTTTKNLMNDLSAFTLEGWVKAASVPDANISLFGQNDVVEFSLSSKKLSLWTKKGGNLVADNPFVSNSWHHVAAIGDGKNLFLYIDGTQIKTQGSVTQNYGDSVSSFQIGGLDFSASGTNNQFQGQIAEVRIWKVARTQTEIQANMHKRLTDKEQNLVGYWPLNKIKPEGTANTVNKVSDLAGNHHGTVTGAIITDDNTLPIVSDAVVSTEYSTVTLDAVTKQKSAIMRRFFASGTLNGVNLLPDKRIETLELNWIGNAQFAPTLLGYIEGAPPIPSENLTEEDDYNGATSVEITMSEDVEFSWRRSQDNGLGASADTFAGANVEITAGLGVETKIADIRAGFKGNLDTSNQFQNESSIASGSSVSMSDKLELRGTVEQDAHFPHLGKRFIPKNVGYALVVSALADVFITRLARSRKMIGYQVQPVENIPPDVNTITFLINPAYVMKGSLDGMTGSRATSDRFFKHVPEMRSQYGSLYPASYYRLQEAYDLKQQIEQQDKQREAYFAQYNALLVDETSLDREVNSGAAPTGISVSREEDKPEGMSDSDWEKEQKRRQNEQLDNIEQQTKKDQDKQSEAEQQKRAEIEAKIKDQEKRTQATASFAGWQKKMEDIQIRAGKRNIVNTYVWDADGGLRTESQSFASTAEHTIGGSFTMNAGLGFEGDFAAGGVGAELTAQATVNMTQTMNKTETRSKGLQLNVDLSGVESKGVTDHNDYPILPGEKVDRYRFMSFYLEGSTNNFFDFFNYVVDPEWLASNDEEARALRQVEAGKPNKAWRVMHRVTYVERPALMGFGRSINQVKNLSELEVKHQDLLDKFKKLATEQQELKSKLDQILQALERRTQNS